MKKINPLVSNIEGLRNPTILQEIEGMKNYIVENAKQGERGALGIYTATTDFVDAATNYPISAIPNFTSPAEFKNSPVYFKNGYIAIVDSITYTDTNAAEPTPSTFTVTGEYNLRGAQGPQGIQGETGPQGPAGADGVSITAVHTISHSVVGDETITRVEVVLSNGTTEPLEIHTENGAQGPQGPEGPQGPAGAGISGIIITAPSGALSGTLTTEQLSILFNNAISYIQFNNEIYYSMDRQHDTGYLTYVHNGFSNTTGAVFPEKAITVNVNNASWVLTVKPEQEGGTKWYRHIIQNILTPSSRNINIYNTTSSPITEPGQLYSTLKNFPWVGDAPASSGVGLCRIVDITYETVQGDPVYKIVYLQTTGQGGSTSFQTLTVTGYAFTDNVIPL